MNQFQISVVIPTCNRKARLLLLLHHLNNLDYSIAEVIIVDSGEDRLDETDYTSFTKLTIRYVLSEKSVCIQRNTGIRLSISPWIFLCDDDIEMPVEYLTILCNHLNNHPGCGAVSGVWLQKENDEWKSNYPEFSMCSLTWKFIFQKGIWGEIRNNKEGFIAHNIKKYYSSKGNHISKAGWPVNTNFAGDYFRCPVYSLGASLIKKEWLLQSPYDEALDQFGIGDNYGVITGFPGSAIDVTNKTSVYHQQEPTNRLKSSLQYYRRVLALDYFILIKKTPPHVKRRWLLWSVLGDVVLFIKAGNGTMTKAAMKGLFKILFSKNPYYKRRKDQKVINPQL